jgi:multidrug resistance efflux pump
MKRFWWVPLAVVVCGGGFFAVLRKPYIKLERAHVAVPLFVLRADRASRIISMAAKEPGASIQQGEILFVYDAEEENRREVELQERLLSLSDGLKTLFENVERAMEDYLTLRTQPESPVVAAEQALTLLQEREKQVDECQREMESSRKNLSQIKRQIQQKSIAAPSSGILIQRKKQAGDVVACGDDICSLYDPTSPWIEAVVSEKSLAQISIGQQVIIQLPAVPNREWEGLISFISPFALENGQGVPVRISIKVGTQREPELSLFRPNLTAVVKIKIH